MATAPKRRRRLLGAARNEDDEPLELVVACSDSTTAVVDLARGTLLPRQQQQERKKTSCSITPSLCVVGGKNTILVRDDDKMEWVGGVSWKSPEALTCVTSWRGFCFAGGKSGRAYVWESWSGRVSRSWEAHYKAVGCISCTEDYVATGGDDGLIHCWLISRLLDEDLVGDQITPFKSFDGHRVKVTALEWTAGPYSRLASCSLDASLNLWEMSSKPLVFSKSAPSGLRSLTAVSVSPDESVLVAGGECGRIVRVDLDATAMAKTAREAVGISKFDDDRTRRKNKEAVADLEPAHTSAVTKLAFVLERRMVSSSLDNTLKIWVDGQLERSVAIDKPVVDFAAFAAKSREFPIAAFFQRKRPPVEEDLATTAPAELLCSIPVARLSSVSATTLGSDYPFPSSASPDATVVPKLQAQVDTLREENDRWQKACDSLWQCATISTTIE